MDITELRERFLNREFDAQHFTVSAEDIVGFATAIGESDPRHLDPQHPDFQASPTFCARFHSGRTMPQDFPRIGIGMDGGKAVEPLAPVRAGMQLVGRSHLHDLYDKTGRSGRMVFTVARMEIFDEATGERVAIVDSRSVMREKPAA